MRMQMEVPLSLEKPQEAGLPQIDTTFFANALKADRNHRFIRSISFMTDKNFI